MSTSQPNLDHILVLLENTKEVARLLAIHETLTGQQPGRRAGVEVLNKSGLVLLVACWEAFIEDLLVNAAEFLVATATVSDHIPKKVQGRIGRELKEDKDDRALWRLTDDGWRTEIISRAQARAGDLNTPSPENIDQLFQNAIGLAGLTSSWSWPRMSAEQARKKLRALIERRGSVAHRVETAAGVHKRYVDQHADFIYRLAVASHNKVGTFLKKQTATNAWVRLKYNGKWRTT